MAPSRAACHEVCAHDRARLMGNFPHLFVLPGGCEGRAAREHPGRKDRENSPSIGGARHDTLWAALTSGSEPSTKETS